MERSSHLQAEVVKRIQECLKELGFEAEIRLSTHEGIVHARKEMDGECVRVVAHITDREVKTASSGSLNFESARGRLARVAIRPTLAAQTATRFVPKQTDPKEQCE